MRVMAIVAHPDDELRSAGTLAKYHNAGHETALVFTTNGEVGSSTLSKTEIALMRKEEARASAEVIGAEFFWMGYPDEFLFSSEEVRLSLIDVVRQFMPDIILCPDKDADYHPDHIATGQIVWDIRVMTTVPNIETPHKPCAVIPKIYYMESAAGVNFLPEIYVDISESWDQKAKMIACHESQKGWLMDQYGVTLEEYIRVQSMFRGFQAGCRYAEAFRLPKCFPGNTDKEGLL